jgi:ATP-binding cassette, subfamily C, bacterial CydC
MSDWRFLRTLFDGVRSWTGLAYLLLALTWAAGIALLALSGWFITAAALAGGGLLLGLDLFTPSAGIRAAALVRTLARYGERVIGHEAVLRVLATLRERTFDRVAHLPIPQQRALRSGDLQQRLTADIDTLDAVPLRITGPVTAAVLAVLAASILAGWLAPWPAAAVIGSTALLTGMAALAAARAGRARGRSLVEERTRQRIALLDFFGGLTELLAYRKARGRRSELEDLEAQQAQRLHVQETIALVSEQAVQLLVALATLAMLGLALHWHAAGSISAPVAILLTLMTLGLNEALGTLPGAGWRLGESLQAAARLQALGQEAQPERPSAGTPTGGLGSPEIRVEGLEIGYAADRPVLGPLGFTLHPGHPLVICGPSGLGKSTLLATLAGEQTPLAGSVRLGGNSIADLSEAERYRCIAYLPQETLLLDDTVGHNLSLGRSGLSDLDMWEALEMVDLAGTLRREGVGLDYPIGEGGQRLSGGQARRLALAWLVLRDAPVVLLDEPFANLDTATAGNVLERLRPWLETRTAVIVTHAPEQLPTTWPRIDLGVDGRLR